MSLTTLLINPTTPRIPLSRPPTAMYIYTHRSRHKLVIYTYIHYTRTPFNFLDTAIVAVQNTILLYNIQSVLRVYNNYVYIVTSAEFGGVSEPRQIREFRYKSTDPILYSLCSES